MTSVVNIDDRPGRPEECSATIRFSHVDAAGIVFYPRYFEILFRNFDEPPMATTPFAMRTEFRRPNRLGDRLRIICEHAGDSGDWSYSGRIDGIEYFSMASLPQDQRHLARRAHRPDLPAFRTSPASIGLWSTGHDGRMQLSRFFEYVSDSIEKWFEETLGLPFCELHVAGQVGIPTVRFITRCRELPRSGETVEMWIRPVRVGRRSLVFTSWLVRGDECLVENEQIIVFVRMTTNGFESMLVPDDIRARIEPLIPASS